MLEKLLKCIQKKAPRCKIKRIWISLFCVINHGLYLLKKRCSLWYLFRRICLWNKLRFSFNIFPSDDHRPQISPPAFSYHVSLKQTSFVTSHLKAEHTFKPKDFLSPVKLVFFFSLLFQIGKKLFGQKKLRF